MLPNNIEKFYKIHDDEYYFNYTNYEADGFGVSFRKNKTLFVIGNIIPKCITMYTSFKYNIIKKIIIEI